MLTTFTLGLIGSAIIFVAYLAISATIVSKVLVHDSQWRTNPLATATAAIFFSCGIGHGLHGLHMLEMGVEAARFFDIHVVLWDLSTAVVAVWYWTLRRRLSALGDSGMLFEDAAAKERQQLAERLNSLFDGVALWRPGLEDRPSVLGDLSGVEAARVTALAEATAAGAETEALVVQTTLGATLSVQSTTWGPGQVLLAWRDVTQAAALDARHRAAQAELAAAFDASPVAMALLEDGEVVRANAALHHLAGRDVTAEPWDLLFPAAERAAAGRLLGAAAQGSVCGDWSVALQASGEQDGRHVSVFLAGVVGSTPAQVVAHLVDVEERSRAEQRLRHVAEHDPLTGLANRRRLEAVLQRQCDTAQRYGSHGALLLLDLDHFKDVNDTLGHQAGDALLTALAGVLQHELREDDLLARLGGDEFAVLLPNVREDEAVEVAARLCAAVRTHCRATRGVDAVTGITASVGIALFGDVDPTPASMLVAADLSLYDAKDAGRDTWALYRSREQAQPRRKSRLEWMDRLRAALDSDGLRVAVQPLRHLATGQEEMAELLLRLPDGRGGLLVPGDFLAAAEQTGLVLELDRWMWRYALNLLRRDPRTLCVNVSARSLSEPGFAREMTARLGGDTDLAARLVLEVTETAVVSDLHQIATGLAELRAAGCRVALDDFGAGFGGLTYVKNLPFDILKIDGQFVERCGDSAIDLAVIDVVVRLAQGLGKLVVAEHVTDEQTLAVLAAHGVHYAQGFHVGRPVLLPAVPAPRAEGGRSPALQIVATLPTRTG